VSRIPSVSASRLPRQTHWLHRDAGGGHAVRWHSAPDGGAVFPTNPTDPLGSGWIYASNSEANGNKGGASAIRFGADGIIEAAYRILIGLRWACAGGMTPWGTWLPCEEYRSGYVWEGDPAGLRSVGSRPALGKFVHEAAVVDPANGFVYLTEDEDRSRLYRFVPSVWGDLTLGVLAAASVDSAGVVTWVPVPDDRPYRGDDTTSFARLEGAWFDGSRRTVFFTTTTDSRVWALDLGAEPNQLRVIYDGSVTGGPLLEPDNITVQPVAPHDLFVAEDSDNLELVRFTLTGDIWTALPFVRLIGHDSSEVAGPALNAAGTHLYFSSQRGRDGKNGMTFEVTRLDGGLI
jgi:uncharacterized protein